MEMCIYCLPEVEMEIISVFAILNLIENGLLFLTLVSVIEHVWFNHFLIKFRIVKTETEKKMEIMTSCNSVAWVWGLNSIDDYCSIDPTQTLPSNWKRFGPSNQPLLTLHNEPSTTSRCQLCQGGLIEAREMHNNRQKEKIFFKLQFQYQY